MTSTSACCWGESLGCRPPWRPWARAERRPAWVRSRTMARSNSANAPSICIIMRPDAVVLSMFSVSEQLALLSNSRFCGTLRAVVSWSCGLKHTGAQELEAGAAAHGSFDGLDAVDLALGGACGPGRVQRRLHGGEVAPEACGEFGQLCGSRVLKQLAQALLALAAQQQVEPFRDCDGLRQPRRFRLQPGDEACSASGSVWVAAIGKPRSMRRLRSASKRP